ncbi:hypothetical protein [Aureibaculum conchae]|uniref:hypothetical protein n=1 Tax=Aureibaculum sp. 2308TA14-22 TaxID=3108392 RepID=UPI0033957F53
MDFQELSTSIKATLYDRASKPFTGTLILSWFYFNWEIIATLFWVSEKSLGEQNRIKYIQENYINLSENILFPFLLTIALIIVMPLFNLGALKVKNFFKKVEFERITKITPVNAKKHADLLDRLSKQELGFNNQLTSLNDTIDDLTESLKNSNENYTSTNQRLSTTSKHLNITRLELEKLKVTNDKILVEKGKIEYAFKDLIAIAELYKKDFGLLRKNETELKQIARDFYTGELDIKKISIDLYERYVE